MGEEEVENQDSEELEDESRIFIDGKGFSFSGTISEASKVLSKNDLEIILKNIERLKNAKQSKIKNN